MTARFRRSEGMRALLGGLRRTVLGAIRGRARLWWSVPVLVLWSLIAACGVTARVDGTLAAARQMQATAGKLRRFSGDGISFSYPATWYARSYQETSSFSSQIVSLSPQTLHQPCTTRHGTHNTTITCRQPLSRLEAGSILANWSTNAFPDWSFARVTGTWLRVGGRPAKLRVTHGNCSIAADEEINVVITVPGRTDSWYGLDACIRDPGIFSHERQLRNLLHTVRFTH
jgi:hypothetical protein